MCSPFTIDIRPRRLPAEIKQIQESSNDHGEINLEIKRFDFRINIVLDWTTTARLESKHMPIIITFSLFTI